MRALMGDEPEALAAQPVVLTEHARPLEGHRDQPGQDAAAHAGQARRRAGPAHHQGRLRAGRRAERVAVAGENDGRVAQQSFADPVRQFRIDDRRHRIGDDGLGRSEQDIGAVIVVEGDRPGSLAGVEDRAGIVA